MKTGQWILPHGHGFLAEAIQEAEHIKYPKFPISKTPNHCAVLFTATIDLLTAIELMKKFKKGMNFLENNLKGKPNIGDLCCLEMEATGSFLSVGSEISYIGQTNYYLMEPVIPWTESELLAISKRAAYYFYQQTPYEFTMVYSWLNRFILSKIKNTINGTTGNQVKYPLGFSDKRQYCSELGCRIWNWARPKMKLDVNSCPADLLFYATIIQASDSPMKFS